MRLTILLAAAAFAAAAHAGVPSSTTGRTPVKDIMANLSPELRRGAEATAALVDANRLIRNPDGTYRMESNTTFPHDLFPFTRTTNLPGTTHERPNTQTPIRNEFCSNEELISDGLKNSEPVFCSAVLTAERELLTAAHCLEHLQATPNRKVRVVFGYYENDQAIPPENVYEFTWNDVLAYAYREGVTDYARVRLDRAVIGRESVEMSAQTQAPVGQKLHSFGFPFGLPMIESRGEVTHHYFNRKPEVNQYTTVSSTLHLSPGNSGGPVFDEQGRLVAINSRVKLPYITLDQDDGCYRWNTNRSTIDRDSSSMGINLVNNPPGERGQVQTNNGNAETLKPQAPEAAR
jgi:V8-like Glu-specific endopeptidase